MLTSNHRPGWDGAVVDQRPHPEGSGERGRQLTLPLAGGIGEFSVPSQDPAESLVLVGGIEHDDRPRIIDRSVLDSTDVDRIR
ncbi:hypothetical protein [Micromonospora sp. NPDC005254]|uniref:hypothetical protein n=1 Tax=Micromonospora sp. NPDC005254 TaxID=3364229 RepID=UPI0036988C30